MTLRLDDLQIGGLKIYQDTDAFCFGMDAVLLSGYARIRPGENVLDIGTGNGVLPILLSAKTEAAHFTGIEIQEEAASLAERNVSYNHLGDRIRIICGDVREAVRADKQDTAGSFQVIVTNPPYIRRGSGICREDARGIARHEIKLSLRELMEACRVLLPDRGRLYMVHRAERLADVLGEMRRASIEPKTLRMVHPYADREAELILVEGIRGGRPQTDVQPPLIIHTADGRYTQEADRIYGIRHGEPRQENNQTL